MGLFQSKHKIQMGHEKFATFNQLSQNTSQTIQNSESGPATILLGSNHGQAVYSHCLPSLLSSKKLG